MEETQDLINGIYSWINSLKESPENDSANGLFEYLASGCNIVISLNHAYIIYRLRTIFNYVIYHGEQTERDFEIDLEMLIDFAPIQFRKIS